ncbi:MAG: tRNA pseudouridine(38-40) synthase TruA [Bacteroidales bacterium]
MRYFIFLQYKGTGYHGWQAQKNALSVQEKIEKCISLLLQEKIELTGAGRTDSGVHASYYVAHFDSRNENLADDNEFLFKLNRFSLSDMAFSDIKKVKSDAHARFSALSRSYKYRITRVKNPFESEFAWYYYGNLDIVKMQQASEDLMKYDNFKSFCKKGSNVKTYQCKVMKAEWIENGNILEFNITADRFLRNMVRSIVSSLMEIGKGNLRVDEFNKLILERKKPVQGSTAPAHGLFLNLITYPENIYL